MSSEANPIYNFPFEDTWPVQLIVSNACGSDTLDTTVVVLKLSIEELQASNLFITAFTGGLNIQSNTGFEKGTLIALYNISGQLVGSMVLNTSKQHSVQMPTSELSPGIFIIRLEYQGFKVARKFLIDLDE